MFANLTAVFSSRSPCTRRKGLEHSKTRPTLEALESRMMLHSAVLNNGVLTLTGTASADYTSVVIHTHGTPWTWDDEVKVDMSSGINHAHTFWFDYDDVFSIVFHGGLGNDEFYNTTVLPSIALGGPGNDTLSGGRGADSLYGQDNTDRLLGNDGHDFLYGGGAVDDLFGGRGNDRLDGGHDDVFDNLTGGAGADIFVYHSVEDAWGYISHILENVQDFNEGEGDTRLRIHHD